MGQAVQSATEGLKNENSILVDNAGVTKNVAKMWQDYANAHGLSVASLSQEQKIEAELIGLRQESIYQTGDAAKMADTYAGKVAGLSNAFYKLKVGIGNIFIPILQKIIPVITTIVNWLTALANRAAQVIQILLGVSVSAADMNAYADGANAAAEAQDNLAGSTEKSGKAAKGALAPFDELNVLQQDTGSDTGASVGVGGLGLDNLEEETGFLDEVDEKIKAIAEGIRAFFEPLGEPLGRIGEAFGRIWDQVVLAAGAIWEDLKPAYEAFRDNVLIPFLDLVATITEKFATWAEENPEKLQGLIVAVGLLGVALLLVLSPAALVVAIILAIITVIGLLVKNWEKITDWAANVINSIGEFFSNLWTNITDWAANALNSIGQFFTNLWEGIKGIWGNAGDWFQTTIIDPIRNAFKTVLDWISEKWETTFTGVKDFVKGVINTIIDFINGMISAVASGLNAVINGLNGIKITIPDWVPIFGGNSWGLDIPGVSAPRIPRLATGAAIPPNSAFAAILGDQRSGYNLEGPEDRFRQIVREELAGIMGNENINVTMPVYLDSEKIYEGQQRVQRRRGNSLVVGGGAA
jgi:hypothetical protein